MSHHDQHGKGHHGHAHHNQTPSKYRGLHKDWRTWVGVLLMLAAIVGYVLSLDESIVPGTKGQEQERMPAAP